MGGKRYGERLFRAKYVACDPAILQGSSGMIPILQMRGLRPREVIFPRSSGEWLGLAIFSCPPLLYPQPGSMLGSCIKYWGHMGSTPVLLSRGSKTSGSSHSSLRTSLFLCVCSRIFSYPCLLSTLLLTLQNTPSLRTHPCPSRHRKLSLHRSL